MEFVTRLQRWENFWVCWHETMRRAARPKNTRSFWILKVRISSSFYLFSFIFMSLQQSLWIKDQFWMTNCFDLQMHSRLIARGKLLRRCNEFWRTRNQSWRRSSVTKVQAKKSGKPSRQRPRNVNAKPTWQSHRS